MSPAIVRDGIACGAIKGQHEQARQIAADIHRLLVEVSDRNRRWPSPRFLDGHRGGTTKTCEKCSTDPATRIAPIVSRKEDAVQRFSQVAAVRVESDFLADTL